MHWPLLAIVKSVCSNQPIIRARAKQPLAT
jgi:hypothetical protein